MDGFTTLITAQTLREHFGRADWAIVDCRFDLLRPAWGQEAYLQGHVPGAIYASLEKDISAPSTGTNGRHPLPPDLILAAAFSRWGIDRKTQVVAYDDNGGGYAARAWWCLRYLGHDRVALLDGGLPAWVEAGMPLRSGEEQRAPAKFRPAPRPGLRIDASEIAASARTSRLRLIDARAPERYRGDEEPIDPVAGHIPAAVNHPWQSNLDAQGRFRPAAELRLEYLALLRGQPPESAAVYCGSGVTACHDLLAMSYAGLDGARLYPGSWSEWCSNAARPVARGPAPGGLDTPGGLPSG